MTLPDGEPSDSATVFVSIGSNIDPKQNLKQALRLLRLHCEVLAVSSVYQSPPYGFTEQPDFLDIAVKVRTVLSPLEFKQQILDEIEKRVGRDRANQVSKYGPLTLDMDILLWDEAAFTFGDKPWKVPDKGIVQFAAVALPLAEIAADVMHPEEGATIAEIAARFEDTDTIKRLDLVIG